MVSSVYIHIPFCKSICFYCDFCKMFYYEDFADKYLEALSREIKESYKGEIIKTIYIGGGTPSILSIKQLNKLFEIIKIFKLDNNFEITFEANINDINEELLKLLKKNKVNRLSIGIETINKKFMKLLNRFNDKQEIINNINLVKKYFNNYNLDLMYAFEGQTIEDLDKDLNFVIELNPTHLSIYSLIIEPHTVLYINKTKPIDDTLECNMYYHIIDRLEKYNYKHYEISNFSKEGFESKHNLVYWNNQEYYGFGLGTSGYVNNVRYTNTRSITDYIDNKFTLEEEHLTKEIDMENYLIFGLRKIDGISKKDFKDKYKCNVEDVFDIISLIKKNLLKDDNGRIYIPKDKLYVSNSILVNFIGGINDN